MRSLTMLLPVMFGVAACGSASTDLPADAQATVDMQSSEVAAAADAGGADVSSQWPACVWPSAVDAGPGACRVGRAYLACDFPSGGSCASGLGFGPNMTMLCISDDPTMCTGCQATTGTPTCASKCAANQYAMECGGVPKLGPDGGFDDEYYEHAPAECVMATPTPSGASFWCCPCH